MAKGTFERIGCLRLDWPKELFTFVGRYQLELEQMRKECRYRFEGISSGACPTCSFRLTSVGMWLCITWIWHNYGVAQLAGAGLEGNIAGLHRSHAQSA